jgi:hypothetical protein
MQAVVLLDGKQVSEFTFSNGVFRTTSPIAWNTPTGETTSVNLHLQFSAFAGECHTTSHSSLCTRISLEHRLCAESGTVKL